MLNKKILVAGAVIMLAVLFTGGCAEEQAGNGSENKQLIQTYGEAEVTAEPDLARLSFEVETRSESADEAVAENAELVNQVREALLDFGLSEDEVRTGSYRLRSRSEDPRQFEEQVEPPQPDELEEQEAQEREVDEMIYYEASNEIVVTTTQLDQAGEIIDTAVSAGANQVNYINFDLEDPQDLKVEALKKATEQAALKAEAIAESADKSITDLNMIKEERTDYTPHREQFEMVEEEAAMDDRPTPVEPEDVEVRASITAEYIF